MNFFESSIWRSPITRAYACLSMAATLGAFTLLRSFDATEKRVLLVLAAVALAAAGVSFWQARRVSPDERVTYMPNSVPRDEQILYFRRAWWSLVVSFPFMTAWIAYNLCLLEKGATDTVFVLAPIALIYERLGFWPAVLALPALGILCSAMLSRKLRALEAE